MYLDSERHPDPAVEAERLLNRLRNGADPVGLGDATLHTTRFDAVTLGEVRRQFGADFADTLEGLDPGVWSLPVRSPFGIHLILVSERRPTRRPALAEIHDEVLAEWRDQRRRETREQAYLRLRDRYEIVIEAGEWADQRKGEADEPRLEASRMKP